MAPAKRAGWLDQVISDSRPGPAPKADFDTWRGTHGPALQRLKERGIQVRQLGWRSILYLGSEAIRRPLVKLAAAAVLVAGILVMVLPYMDRAPTPSEPAGVAKETTPLPVPSESEITARELLLAQDLFTHHDARGLVSLLSTAHPQTAAAIAAYLGQIGDLSAVPTLDAFAARWQGPARDNPFQQAVAQIRDRREPAEQTDTPPVAVEPPQTTGTPLAATEPPPPREDPIQTCRGLVVDRTGTPVEKALVWVQSCSKDLKFTNLVTPVFTNSRGKFLLHVRATARDPADVLYLLCRHPTYALGWTRLPTDTNAGDLDDRVIVLSEPTVVTGTVMDSQGRPIAGAVVEARVAAEQDPASTGDYPYAAGNNQATKTDAQGRFVLGDVPAGSALNLFVSRPDYAAYDSRESPSQIRETSQASFVDPESYRLRAGQQNVLIELVSAAGQIDGRIVRQNGTPYEGDVTVLCVRADVLGRTAYYGYAEGKWTAWDRLPRGRCSAVKGGRFRIEGLARGTYRVAAADPVSRDLLTAPADVLIDGRTPMNAVTLPIRQTARITVHVLDAMTTKPVGDALVVADNGMTMHKRTDPNGLCVFHLVPGNYSVSTHGWISRAIATVQVTSSSKDQRIELPVVVSPPTPGRLVDEFGLPVRGSVCRTAEQQISTDAQGRFLLPGATSDAVALARDRTGARARLFLRKTTDQGELEVRVERVATLIGRIVDTSGQPLASGTTASFSFIAPAVSTARSYVIQPLACRANLVNGRFRFEIPTGLPLRARAVVAGSGAGQAEFVDPVPGQTHDLGDIVLRTFSSPQP